MQVAPPEDHRRLPAREVFGLSKWSAGFRRGKVPDGHLSHGDLNVLVDNGLIREVGTSPTDSHSFYQPVEI